MVQQERPQRQRMPIGGHRVAERPGKVRPSQINMSVPEDERTIINFDEIAVQRGEKRPEHQPEQQQAEENHFPVRKFPNWLECGFQNRKDGKHEFRGCPFSSKIKQHECHRPG